MVEPHKKGPGGFTHLLVAVDKFTKWIDAKPITNIRLEEAVKFYLDIIYRFSVPNCIITDHGTNFTGKKFLDFSDGYGIRIDWALVGHPCTNGQVERANGMVLQGLKSRIFDRLNMYAGRWVAEVPAILWSLRTTPNRSVSSDTIEPSPFVARTDASGFSELTFSPDQRHAPMPRSERFVSNPTPKKCLGYATTP